MEAAFFDLDKTVIAKASTVAFGRPLYREGLLSRWLLLRALYAQLVYLYLGADDARLARMRNAALALTKGWNQETVRRVVRETLEEVIDPIVFEEALELIRQHHDEGRLVLIVSAAPEEIVRPLADYLGADGAIATRARIDAEGRYSGELERYCYGPAKRDAIIAVAAERGIDLAASYAYSDSVTDVPMLEAVGHPVAVNPDRPLLRVARAKEWEVRRFVKPVRLRDRVPMPNAAAAAGGGVTLAAVVAAAVVWWYLHRQPPAPARPWWVSVTRPGASWQHRRRG
ncbi:MAG: HAD-superfamily subfamily hydrolase [Acidimicrobiales bacterium]|nr:HAD-superfamily subfamily hydrolase [Acidimicrobiales bacterium]